MSLLALFGLATAVSATAFVVNSIPDPSAKPNVLDMLSAPTVTEHVQLYPANNPEQIIDAVEFRTSLKLDARTFLRVHKKDGVTVDTYFRADHTTEFVLEYYPAPLGMQPFLKSFTAYDKTGLKPVGSQSFGANRIRTTRGELLANGHFQLSTYAGDGINVVE